MKQLTGQTKFKPSINQSIEPRGQKKPLVSKLIPNPLDSAQRKRYFRQLENQNKKVF